jgi:predicted DCC family thiol-disulfide oxidoreductase YuxK
MTDNRNISGWVCFDAECRFCARLGKGLAPLLRRHGFVLTPLQTPWVEARVGPHKGTTWSEMLLLTPDGARYGGADALLEVARSIWWSRPLYWFSHLPGVRPALRKLYGWVARHRQCLGGTCRAKGARGALSRSLKWLPALALPALAMAMGRRLSGWEWMWVIAFALFLGAKWVTLWELLSSRTRISPLRCIAYALLWPGMDVRAFCTDRSVPTPSMREWGSATAKTLLGAALVWLAILCGTRAHPMVVGWIGMVGLVFGLHFGSFHLLSLGWRSLGIDAVPIMGSPVCAPSLSAFWGGHWNRAFRDLMHWHFLIPLARRLGLRGAVIVVFLVSGLLHELVISLPAHGGYGLPTLYFGAQGLGLLLERSGLGKRLGLGGRWRGRMFALAVAGGPAFWLLHPPFIHHVIVPMLQALGAR